MSKTRMGKRVASLLLSLVMMLSLLPTTVYATGDTGETKNEIVGQATTSGDNTEGTGEPEPTGEGEDGSANVTEGEDGAATNDAVVEETIAPVNAEGVDAVANAENSGDEVSGANVSEGNNAAAPAYAAKIGALTCDTLDDAIKAVQDGEIIEVNAGEYKLPGSQTLYAGKAFTIKAADGATVSFDMTDAVTLGSAKVTFENVTFDYKSNSDYKGLQHATTLVYNNCTINGKVFLYAASETFNNCKFVQKAVDYNVWTYGAQNVAFNGCIFNCAGKAVLVYNEGAIAKTDLTVTDTKFIASAPVEGKAAIEIDTSLMKDGTTITIDAATEAEGFAEGSNSKNSLWNDKNQTADTNKNTTVTVAGVEVFVPVATASAVAKIGEAGYDTLADAIAAAEAGQTVTLLANTTEDVIINKNITLDLGGKTLTNTSTGKATISVSNGATATVKNGSVVGGTSFYTIQNNGTATLEDVTATAGNTGSSMLDNWGTLTITSGTYTGGLDTVKSEEGSVLTINGGKFISDYAPKYDISGVVMAYGTTTINGGEFIQNSTTTGSRVIVTGIMEGYTSITYVKGGSFTSKGGAIFHGIGKATSDNFEVSGGTFNKSISDGYCADGFIPTKNADGTYGVKEGQYVAKSDATKEKYDTLQAAITDTYRGKTVTLLTDVTENVEISKGKRVTLDLNGCTLNGGTGTAKAALTNYGTITITDTSEAKAGTIKRDDNGIPGETSYYVIDNKGTMTIESGTVRNNSGYKQASPIGSMNGSSLICNGDCDEGGTLTIKGGTFTQNNFIAIKNGALGVLHVTGGTITSEHSAIQNWFKADITGGEIKGQLWTDAYKKGESVGETKIGGNAKFNGEIVMDIYGSVAPTLEINGGNLDVTNWRITKAAADAGAKPAVSGGTFTSAVPENYCAAGYIPTKNEGGTYGVKAGAYVAQIGDVKYETLKDAINAAKSSTSAVTITLLQDVTVDHQLVIENTNSKAITLDLNSFTLTSTYAIDTSNTNGSYALVNKTALTVKNGTFAAGQARAIGALATLTLDGATVTQTLTGGHACVAFCANDTAYTIKNSTITGAYAVCSFAHNAIITITGSTLNGSGCGLYHNGSNYGLKLTVTDTKINGSLDGAIGNENDPSGVYISGSTATVEKGGMQSASFTNCTIKGATAIEVKYTDLKLDKCTVEATVKTPSYNKNNNGMTALGFAVVSTDNAMNSATPKPEGTITITGDGKYTGPVGLGSLASVKTEYPDFKDETIKVSGGTFSSAVMPEYCAEDYVPTQNEDGTYGVREANYVAQVLDKNGNPVGVKYETLQAAIDAATRNQTVKLLANTKANVTISTPYLTLDLNGFTLNGSTGERKPALTITARVTVKDSSVDQTGTIMREDTAGNSGVSSHYVIDVQGDGWLTFEGGNVKNGSGAGGTKGASLVRVGDDSVAKYPGLNIKGGTFTQDNFIVIKVDRGDLFLNGGTLTSAASYAIENWHRATVKGGTVNGDVSSWTYSGGLNSSLEISGGTINGDVTSVNYGNAEGKKATVTIKGGAITGELDTRSYDPTTGNLTSITDAAKATIEITDGTFSSDPTKYVVESSKVTKNSEGKYGVKKAYLATVGDSSYYTMEEAFKAQTTSKKPIVLLCDYTTGSSFSSGSINRTVDLNGHTWTCTGTDANSAAFEINYSDVTLTVKNGKVVSSQLVGLIPSAIGGTITYNNSGLLFDGVVMTTTATSGIETNGNNTNDTVTLKDSTLDVPNGFGIYFPSSGTLTIDNSTINAKTMGVQVCAGSLSINAGSTITVTGDGIEKTGNDGAIQDGAAISIVNRTGYKGLNKIEVTGGTFTAKTGNKAIKAYNWDNNTESDWAEAGNNINVSGGTFSSAVPEGLCKDGYISVANGDGTHIVKEGVYVAKVDNVKYETLQKAINAAKGGSTVRLLANVTLTETAVFPAGKKVDLNLVGHNITATGTALRINGTTDIQSTGGNGVIESTGNVAVAVGDNASLTVYSGTLKGREGAVITGTSTGAKIEIRTTKPTLIATDNAVIAGNGSKRDGKPNTILVKGGTFIGDIVTKGYIACGIYAPWNDNVTVSGGTFNITNGAGIVARAGTVKVTGGTFNCGDGKTTGWVGDSKNNVPNAALVFDKAANYPALTNASQILVSGGSFSTDPAANGATLADGFEPKQGEDGMYTLVASDPVAAVNGVGYATLGKAITAAQATAGGATITLLKDIKTSSYYTVNGDNPVTIDLNNHNITGSGISGLFYVTAKGDLTIKGEGTVTAVEDNGAAMAVWVRSPIAKVTLEGGTYTQQISDTTDPQFDLIYVERGNVYVKGGTYKGATPDWTLNCNDDNYKAKEANIEVTGGTFYGFDPSANHEGAGTTYVKTGYVSTKNTDGTYTVEEYKPVEVWTGYSGTKVASYATIEEAAAHLGDNKWIVIAKNYTLTEDFPLDNGVSLDVADGATLTVAEGVTLTVAKNAKRLGVRTGATLVNNGTIMVCGTSHSNGFAMLYGTFTGNELTVPNGCFLDNNGKNFFATANEDAVYEITFGDGTVKKTADSTNIKGGDVKQIKLLQNVTKGGWTLDSRSVGPEVVLDLNGHELSYNGANRYYATLNVYTKVTIKNGTVKYEGSERGAIDLVGQGDLTIESDVTIDGGGAFAIFTSGTSKLTVNGTVKANGNYAIAGNGSKDAGGYIDSCNITVNDGAAISAPEGIAIYHPEKGTVTINGGTITGHTGVQMCSGELVINGGTIVTTGAKGNIGNDGGILDGAAVSIINRSYPGGTPTATIAGGTFTSANGIVAVQAYTVSGTTASEWTDVAEYVNISGGTFSSIPDNMAALCKVGYRAIENTDNNVYIVKEANIAIQVTSRIKDDGVTTVSTTTGGGMYCEGEKVTVTTSNVVGFKFLGWYEKDSYMTQLSADLSYTFTASKDCTLVALYSPAENATLTVKVTASAFKITGSRLEQNNGGMYKLPVGSSVTVTYTDETYEFLYWVNGSDKIVSTSPEYTFTLGSNTELRACTSPKNTGNDNAMVVFKTAYDQVLTAKRYGNDEEIVFPMGPSKTGYKFIGWSMTQAGIRAAMAENDYIVVTPEYETLGTKYTVTVKYEGIEKAEDKHTINVGDSILLTAAERVGERTFSYWMIDDQIVSYLTTLTVFESKDVTVTAVYGVEANAKAMIRISDVSATQDGLYYLVTFTQAFALPEDATLVLTGFIRADDAESAANMNINRYSKIYKSSLTTNDGTYYQTIASKNADKTYYMMAFVQYKDAKGDLQTVYSECVQASYASLKGGN